jgi:hypothetical protein
MKVIDLTADYNVSAAENVILDIIIGDAQIGSSIVRLNQKEKGRGSKIHDLIIGKGSVLKNKALLIKSIVTDVSDSTNQTSITYVLKGGVRNQEFTSSGTVEKNGDAIIYRAKFNFV